MFDRAGHLPGGTDLSLTLVHWIPEIFSRVINMWWTLMNIWWALITYLWKTPLEKYINLSIHRKFIKMAIKSTTVSWKFRDLSRDTFRDLFRVFFRSTFQRTQLSLCTISWEMTKSFKSRLKVQVTYGYQIRI